MSLAGPAAALLSPPCLFPDSGSIWLVCPFGFRFSFELTWCAHATVAAFHLQSATEPPEQRSPPSMYTDDVNLQKKGFGLRHFLLYLECRN